MDFLEGEADLVGVTGIFQILRVADAFACRSIYRYGFSGEEPQFVDVLPETRAQTVKGGNTKQQTAKGCHSSR